jgi:nucleoside-diphosphate-sugar epimerase
VKDICSGFLAIANSSKTIGEEINIATGKDISIAELANKIVKKINPKAKVVLDKQRSRPEKSEVESLVGSRKKISMLTDWKPKYSLENGLDKTIAWFECKENLKLYKPGIYNV